MAVAVVLVAGGLDSLLVVKLMQQTHFQLKIVHFDIGLTTDKPVLAGQRVSKYGGLEYLVKNGIEIEKFDIAKEFYTSVLSYRSFANSNPCLEAKAFILKYAKQYLEKIGADIIVTGDVVDQRAQIQGMENLQLVDQSVGVQEFIFRPLSAKLFPKLSGIPYYKDLEAISYDFKGFDVRRQELAKELQISYYPIKPISSADPEMAMGKKAFEIFEKGYVLNKSHINRLGVHYTFNENSKAVFGRTPFESNYLKSFYEKLNDPRYMAFSVDEPNFIFGFLYGTDVQESHEKLAAEIFVYMIQPSSESKLVTFYDHDNLLLGSKIIMPCSSKLSSQHVAIHNEFNCPVIFLQKQK